MMLTRLAQVLYPPACVLCSRRLALPSAALCPACERACPVLLPPVCRCCGIPLRGAYDLSSDCPACRATPPSFRRARAPFLYDDGMRDTIRRFKYQGHRRLGFWMADAMAQAAAASIPLEHLTGVVATPLHWLKRRVKGWNPAEALADHLSCALGLPYRRRALARIRWTATQTRLTPAQRRRNTRAAFRASTDIAGESVLLVDDVLTTGATAQACAAALIAAGASEVFVVTAARAALRP